MTHYLNTGAPIHRGDGSVVESGEVFEPTDRELRTRAHKLEPAGEVSEEPEPDDPLSGISFASPEAREAAEGAGLDATDFDGLLGTGQGHAFVKPDVERITGDD